jgi:hypothetical protein
VHSGSGWEQWLALTTLLLAIAAAFSAVFTWRLAKATSTLATSAAIELEGTVRPVLIDVPIEGPARDIVISFDSLGLAESANVIYEGAIAWRIATTRQGSHLFSVPVRNVGQGAAVVWKPEPSLKDANDPAAILGRASVGVIPVGEIGRMNFVVPSAVHTAWVEIAYTDITGQQPTRTRLFLRREPDHSWEFLGIALYRDHDEEPIVAWGETWDDPQPGLAAVAPARPPKLGQRIRSAWASFLEPSP